MDCKEVTEKSIQNAGYWVEDTGYKIQGIGYKV